MGTTGRARPLARLGLVAVAVAAGAIASFGVSASLAASTTLSLNATARNACAPAALSAPAGEVTIVFTNPTDDRQSFGVVGVGVGTPEDVRDGESSRLTATYAPGTYTFWCGDDVDDEDVMRGTLTVTGSASPDPVPAPPPSPTPSPPAALTVTASDYAFSPTTLEAVAGPITVTVTNAGRDQHTWTVPGLVSVTLEPGQTKTASFSAAAGTYEFYCAVGGHIDKGMRGTLVVRAGAGGPQPPPAPTPAPPPGPPPAPPSADGTLSVSLVEFAFQPSALSAAAGAITLTVSNAGALPHTFTIDGLVDVEVAPRESKTVTFTAAAGSYTFYCGVSGHRGAGMTGTLVVSAPGAAPPPTPPAPPASPPPPPPAGVSAPPAHQHPPRPAATPPRLPRGCAPRASATVAGTVLAVTARLFVVRASRGAPTTRSLRGRRVSLLLHAATARPADVQRGARVLARAGRCRALGRRLIALRVATPAAPRRTTLELSADPSGLPAFDKTALEAPAGTVTLRLSNPSPLPHNVSIDGHGYGKVVGRGEVSTVTARLRRGRYVFFCAVSGHARAGMRGTLTVR